MWFVLNLRASERETRRQGDAATGKQVRSVVHPTVLDCLVVAPDGKSFAAAGADKLGATSANWVVSAVKVKRLDPGK